MGTSTWDTAKTHRTPDPCIAHSWSSGRESLTLAPLGFLVLNYNITIVPVSQGVGGGDIMPVKVSNSQDDWDKAWRPLSSTERGVVSPLSTGGRGSRRQHKFIWLQTEQGKV